jgi:hypothetical protein
MGTSAFVVKESSGEERRFVILEGDHLRAFDTFLSRFR